MRYESKQLEEQAILRVAEAMVAAARTAPKACAIDHLVAVVLDGKDKDDLTDAMRSYENATIDQSFFDKDASAIDKSTCIVFIGISGEPRGLNCSLCGAKDCAQAVKNGIACALVVHDLGIAVGSAVSVAMDNRIDNRIFFTAGMAALQHKIFPENVKICFGIPLSATGKNIFFDRPASKK
jgi:uncharacterized ferredoxin-like protein